MKTGRSWFWGRGRGRDGKEGGRRVVMGGLIFQYCTGALRLLGSRGCLGFGTVTVREGVDVALCAGKVVIVSTHLGQKRV